MPQVDSHCKSLSRSHWSWRQSSGVCISRNAMQSSANSLVRDVTQSGGSLMDNKNRVVGQVRCLEGLRLWGLSQILLHLRWLAGCSLSGRTWSIGVSDPKFHNGRSFPGVFDEGRDRRLWKSQESHGQSALLYSLSPQVRVLTSTLESRSFAGLWNRADNLCVGPDGSCRFWVMMSSWRLQQRLVNDKGW